MLKKIIIISLLISVYISNITTIVYSANKNEKIALASNLQYEKVLENLSNKNIEDTQLIRKSFPQQYEKFISEYYQKNYRIIFNKNWNELSEKGKKLFLGIGIKSNLKQKLQNLNPETLNYLLEFINNYGDNEVIQKSFENVINLIPETEDKSNLNFLQKLLHTNHSLVFLKILEKLMLNFGVIKSENKQKITDKLYEGSSDIVKKAVDKFLGVLLMFNEEELAQKIVNIIKVKSKLSLSEQFLIALQKGHTNTVKVFLKNGFNANYTDDHGFTALMIAAKHGHLEMVEFFLKNGFDITAKTDIEGYTALLIAVRKGYSKIVRLLLQNHANINDRTRDGCNALMLAVKSGDLETVKVILENWGSRDVNIKTYAREEQDDPAQLDLDSLMLNDKTEALNLLLKNDAYIDGRMRNPRAFLVRNGVNLSDSDVIQPEFNALMFAAQSGHTYIVKLLLEKGADNIGTALEFASKNGHIETVRLLLNKADVDAKNKSL
jgi:ankyrin repeat protein